MDYKDKEIELLELTYKIIDINGLGFAIGFTNNKLGFQIKTYLPEDNKINFIVLYLPVAMLILGFSGFINLFTEEKNISFQKI